MRLHDRMGVEIITAAFGSEGLTRIIGGYQARYGGTARDKAAPIGASIPLPARLLAIADAFDAMTTDRPYSKAMTFEAAVARLQFLSGKKFDSQCVDAMARAVASGELTAAKARVAAVAARRDGPALKSVS